MEPITLAAGLAAIIVATEAAKAINQAAPHIREAAGHFREASDSAAQWRANRHAEKATARYNAGGKVIDVQVKRTMRQAYRDGRAKSS